jgi:hypothetical protein
MEGYAIGINNGFMSPNECRRLEQFNCIPPEKGGDSYMVNGNMVKLEDVGAAYGKGGDDHGDSTGLDRDAVRKSDSDRKSRKP